MTTVRQVLKQKGHDVWTIRPDATVYDAIQLMAEKNIGSLVVMDGDVPVGMLTERLYAREVILKDRSSPDTPVREIMDTKVIYARPDQTVEECMAIMTEMRVRHLPVVQDGELIGIVSIGDMVKSKIEDQQFIIDQLVHFIRGDRG